MKIKIKLIIIASLLLIATVTGFSVLLNIQLTSSAQGIFERYLSDVAVVQAASLNTYANDIADRFDVITSLPEVQTFTSGSFRSGSSEYETVSNTLNALTKSGTLTSAVIYDEAKNVVIASGSSDSVTNASGICNTEAPERTPVIFTEEGSKKEWGVSVRGRINKFFVGLVFIGIFLR